MGYDRGNSFPFDFEPNEIPFGSKSEGKLSPRSYPIQFDRKCKTSFVSVRLITAVSFQPGVWIINSSEVRSFFCGNFPE